MRYTTYKTKLFCIDVINGQIMGLYPPTISKLALRMGDQNFTPCGLSENQNQPVDLGAFNSSDKPIVIIPDGTMKNRTHLKNRVRRFRLFFPATGRWFAVVLPCDSM